MPVLFLDFMVCSSFRIRSTNMQLTPILPRPSPPTHTHDCTVVSTVTLKYLSSSLQHLGSGMTCQGSGGKGHVQHSDSMLAGEGEKGQETLFEFSRDCKAVISKYNCHCTVPEKACVYGYLKGWAPSWAWAWCRDHPSHESCT
jgi:hypothetical protein